MKLDQSNCLFCVRLLGGCLIIPLTFPFWRLTRLANKPALSFSLGHHLDRRKWGKECSLVVLESVARCSWHSSPSWSCRQTNPSKKWSWERLTLDLLANPVIFVQRSNQSLSQGCASYSSYFGLKLLYLQFLKLLFYLIALLQNVSKLS